MISNENANTVGLEIAVEIENLFRTASEKSVTVKLESSHEAEALRFKLHHVRKQMRRYSHPLLEQAENVAFKIKDNVLVAAPSSDKKYRRALARAITQAVEGEGNGTVGSKRNASKR